MKRSITKIMSKILKFASIRIPQINTAEFNDPSFSFMSDPYLQGLLIDELSAIASNFFNNQLAEILTLKLDFKNEIKKFFEIYSNRPLINNIGGSGFCNAFWIFLISRILNPELIVESGVWKGHMSWLLENACPNSVIHGFDINLSRLEYKNTNVFYHEHDWATYEFNKVNPYRSLVFFDCHVNHAQRIMEAYKKGFRYLLFDDNPPLHKLYAYGRPGFPTANIIFNFNNFINQNYKEISWIWRGKKIRYEINIEEIKNAKDVIKKHQVFPDVGCLTKYGGFSFLTFVELG